MFKCRFFPYDLQLSEKFYDRMLNDMPEIDILGSYIYQEKYVAPFLTGVKKELTSTVITLLLCGKIHGLVF